MDGTAYTQYQLSTGSGIPYSGRPITSTPTSGTSRRLVILQVSFLWQWWSVIGVVIFCYVSTMHCSDWIILFEVNGEVDGVCCSNWIKILLISSLALISFLLALVLLVLQFLHVNDPDFTWLLTFYIKCIVNLSVYS